jgi:1A family penicillin-binding protein
MNFQKSWKDNNNFKKTWHRHKIKKNAGISGKITFKKILFNPLTIKIAAVLFLSGALFIIGFFIWVSRDLPNPNQLMDREIAQSTKIYDRTGEHILYDIHGEEQRTMIELKDLPNYIKQATIAIEDKDFYNHKGISIWGILRGVIWQAIRGQRIQGGSTLTQQFVKNAILTSERSIIRKAKEWILAWRIEKKFEKDEILQMYLNEIPYGSTAYGIEAAAQRYFSVNAADLSLAQAAVLAALPQAPSYYSANREALIGRQRKILSNMVEQGYITEEEAQKAREEEIKLNPPQNNITAPHFVMYIKELLTEKYGEKTVEQGGLKIYTTLDTYKQEIAEEAIEQWWKSTKITDSDGEEKKYNSLGASNAALVSINPKTGEVLAMVGSRDYYNDEIDGQYNVATSYNRQPGSSLKPLVYATLFTKGYTPNTILYDVETNFSSDPEDPYEPHNYNLKEYGPIQIKKALGGSLNIPAVKAIYLAGLDTILETAKKFGYTNLNNKEDFGLSLALGGASVQLLEHTNAYGVFAREGLYHPTVVILKVEDSNGKILEEWQPSEERILDENIAREINDILSDNSNRAYIFGEYNNLLLPNRPVAAKTGTTNDYRDAWTMGYTPSLVAGVWVGNSDNSKMSTGTSGGASAASIWNYYMKKVLGDTPVEEFKKPEIPETGKAILDGKITGEPVKIDKITGLLATEFTPAELVEEKIYNEHHSILYYIDKDDPLGPAPENPENDPQFKEWENRVQEWAKKIAASSTNSAIIDFIASGSAPTASDNIHLPENKPMVKINRPSNNSVITEPYLTTEVSAEAKRGLAHVYYYLNGNLFIEKSGYFFNLDNQPIDFLSGGYHNLKVRACDDAWNCSEDSVEFNLVTENVQPQDFSATVTWPLSGLALSIVDFPTNIKIETNNPTRIARVEVFLRAGDKDEFLGQVYPAGQTDSALVWKKPASGQYIIYGKAYGWNGEIKNTNEVPVMVN